MAASLNVVGTSGDRHTGDAEVCRKVIDTLRDASELCRSFTVRANHIAVRTALHAVGLLCESGVIALRRCVRQLEPGNFERWDRITQKVISLKCTDGERSWRPGPWFPSDEV